jgi:hypothetical protein
MKRRLRGCLRGCLILIILFAIPYLIHMLSLISDDNINRSKWNAQNIHSYTITLSYQFGSQHEETTITVKDDKPVNQINVDNFAPNKTMESLFPNPIRCGLLFPIGICSVEYDAEYGYPTKVSTRCPMIECYTEVSVLKFNPN